MVVKAMPSRLRDRIAGAVLLAVALIWIGLVYWTIDPGEGTVAGARTFPLFFGLLLALLSLVVMARTFFESHKEELDAEPAVSGETVSVVGTIGVLAAYGFLLQPLGFILTTVILVAGVMIFLLRIRAPLQIAAVSLGLAVACYLVFGKLLGTYLPPGTLFPIYF